MGTGKTRTALELIKIRLDKGKVNKILWLCPCSVKENLRRDLLKHCDDISNIIICGIQTLSSSIRAYSKLLELVQTENVYLIVDESNLVKNHYARRTERIVKLSEYCKYKLILNGTPISRSEEDLFSQWYILDWRILGYQSFWSFAANHLEYDEKIPGKINKCLNTDYLVKKIAPYTYQVKKSECLDLPEKTYEVEFCNMHEDQRKHYYEIADELMFKVDELEPETIYRLFSALQSIISGFRVTTGKHLTKVPFFKNPTENPRIEKLMSIVECIAEKTIIFCKYTYEIKIIAKLLNEKYGEKTAVTFYGELNQKKRQKNLDEFRNNAQFLIANKACAGYGLNLQFCSYVIYYSNDWDYATRSQSEDRVHRIGQNKNVHIIDICTSYTLDYRILKCLWRKEDLVDSFKREIDAQKDNKESFVEKYIFRKDYKGRAKISKTEKVRIETFKDLEEK